MNHNVAEAIVESLSDAGVEVVFGLPGVHNLALFAALEASEIRTVVVRHEATAAYAADAVGRLTGRPGVCVTTSGPGAANAVTAMGEAQASRSPLLHITTTVARRHLDPERSRGVLHEHPRQRAIFEPVSKLARHLGDPSAAAEGIRTALDTAAAAPTGPVYLELPTDLLEDPAAPAQSSDGALGRAPAPTRDELRDVAGFLAGAERPAIWVGSGAAHAGDAIVQLADRLQAPIVLTHSAKRRWSASPHPLVLAHPPHEPAVGELLAESDGLLVLGSDLDGMMTQEFRLPLEPLVRVDIDAERAAGDDKYASVKGVVGDAEAVVGALLKLLVDDDGGWGGEAVPDADRAAREALAEDPDAEGGLAFLQALDGALGDREAAVVCDMAVSGYWTGGYLPLGPGRRVLYPLGWGTLGFALPASVGAAAAPGARRTVAICGDGGVLFAIGELATIAQEQLDVTVVVHNDSCYGMLRYDELRRFGRSFAVDLQAPDFVALAQSFGLQASRTDLGDGDFADVLGAAIAAEGPALVEVTGTLSPPRVTSARWPLAAAAAAGH